MFSQIKTSEANRSIVTELTNKLNLGAENIIARVAFAYSLANSSKLSISLMKDSQGKEYSKNVKSGKMKVSPFDLLINYDVLVRDGSIPGGNFSESWLQMFDILMKNPELNQMFEIPRIFKHIARNLGAKNVDDFVRVQGMPTEQVEGEAQKGNITPLVGY